MEVEKVQKNMDENKPLYAMITVFGVLIVCFLILNVVVFASASVPKITSEYSETEDVGQADEDVTEEEHESREYTLAHEGFTANSDRQSVVEEDEPDEAVSNQWICEATEYRLIDDQDLADIENREFEGIPEGVSMVQMVINEMYARHGFVFGKEPIQNYFEQQQWYQDIDDRSDWMKDIDDKMSDVERKNIDFLLERR